MSNLLKAGGARKADSAKLPLLRFEDLRSERIVRTWTTLNKWIDSEGFPPGRLLGTYRVWTESEVMNWVMTRPTAKGALKGAAKNRHAQAGAA